MLKINEYDILSVDKTFKNYSFKCKNLILTLIIFEKLVFFVKKHAF
jgi:hypothetical protein